MLAQLLSDYGNVALCSDMAMGWVDPWVGLGRSSSVKYELLPNNTGKYYFQSRILFNINHFCISNITMCTSLSFFSVDLCWVEVFCEITFVMVCNGIFVIDGLGWVGLGYENWTRARPYLDQRQA